MKVLMIGRHEPGSSRARIADLERRLEIEDERRALIEQATSEAELEQALTHGLPEPPRRRPDVVGRVVPAVGCAVAVLLVLGLSAYDHVHGTVDWANVAVGTGSPFSGTGSGVSAYIVPLDRTAWNTDGGLSLQRLDEELAAEGINVVETQPFAMSEEDYNHQRRQLNSEAVVGDLESALQRDGVSANRPYVVIGVTSLDEYGASFSYDRFVFMSHQGYGNGGVAVISTARMRGGSKAERDRLFKMSLRAVGFYVFHKARTTDWSAMHDPIRSVADLDRMQPRLDAA